MVLWDRSSSSKLRERAVSRSHCQGALFFTTISFAHPPIGIGSTLDLLLHPRMVAIRRHLVVTGQRLRDARTSP